MPTNIPTQSSPDIAELSDESNSPAQSIRKAERETSQNTELDEEFTTIMRHHGRTVEALTNR